MLGNPRQKPCDRLHEGIVIHNGIPLIARQPRGGIAVMLRQNQLIGRNALDCGAEHPPEGMVEFLCFS